jgi:hypothetical protein
MKLLCVKTYYVCTCVGSSGCKHLLLMQHCFLLPVPPNFLISRQHLQEPQSSCVHPVHCPHLLRFLPTNTCMIKIKLCACTKCYCRTMPILTNGSLDGCCVSCCASEWSRLECVVWSGCMIWLGWALLYCFQKCLCSL